MMTQSIQDMREALDAALENAVSLMGRIEVVADYNTVGMVHELARANLATAECLRTMVEMLEIIKTEK